MSEQTRIAERIRHRHIESYPDVREGHREGPVHLVRETEPASNASRHGPRERLIPETVPPSRSRLLGSAVRVSFGLIWLIDAYFKWQPSFLNGLLDVMHDGTAGQPGWLMPWFNLTHALISLQPTVWAYGIALVETGIALALLLGVARKLTYVGGAVWGLLIWSTAEGFGRMSGGVSTDIGAGIIYSVVFLALLAADQCRATRPYSLDAAIERRLSWWVRIAEMQR